MRALRYTFSFLSCRFSRNILSATLQLFREVLTARRIGCARILCWSSAVHGFIKRWHADKAPYIITEETIGPSQHTRAHRISLSVAASAISRWSIGSENTCFASFPLRRSAPALPFTRAYRSFLRWRGAYYKRYRSMGRLLLFTHRLLRTQLTPPQAEHSLCFSAVRRGLPRRCQLGLLIRREAVFDASHDILSPRRSSGYLGLAARVIAAAHDVNDRCLYSCFRGLLLLSDYFNVLFIAHASWFASRYLASTSLYRTQPLWPTTSHFLYLSPPGSSLLCRRHAAQSV